MENENEKIFSISDDGEYFVITFDKFFNKEKFKVFNQFALTSKRNFKMLASLICETYNDIFLNEDGNVKDNLQITMLQILNVQSKIMREQTMPTDTFINYLKMIVNAGDSAIIKEISNYVENGYQLTLDADTKAAKKKNKAAVNDQLIISDEYAKILIKIAYLERLMIPLISQFFLYNKAEFPTKVSVIVEDEDDGEELVFNDINQKIFNVLFELIAGENTTNIQNKLYKMVYSRIIKTAFSSNKFWSAARSVGISKESASLDIYSKLLSNSMPKIILSKELNVVSFLSAIINNQIIFLFSNKFKTHYQILNPNSDGVSLFESNDENMTEMEKMEIQLGHKNEGSLIINNVMAEEVISKIEEYLDVSATKEEISSVMQYIHMNPIQERIIALITFKYFNGTDIIKRLNAYEYAKLLLCSVKYLEKQKFILLPKILLSKCIKQRDRIAITGTKVKNKIETSKRYTELMTTKYKDFHEDIERNIQSLMSTIYSSSFIDLSGVDVFDSTAKIGNIAEEIVDLCFLI